MQYDVPLQDEVLTELDADGVLTITLNRPAALNALTTRMTLYMPALMREIARDVAVKVVVVRGAGRGFCAGGDIKSGVITGKQDQTDPMSARHAGNPAWEKNPEARLDRLMAAVETPRLLHTMGKPTIAMLHGAVAGAGMSMACSCDLRIAASSTVMTSAFSRIGASGDWGGSYFVTQLVGPAKAREIYFLSEKMDAQECLRLGLVNRVVADEDLEREAYALARRLAESPPIALRCIKENINAAESQSLHDTLRVESHNMVRTTLSQDAAEAMAAFAEKREGVYRGV